MTDWSSLPNEIFDLLLDHLSTLVRLIVVERCCRTWRIQSLEGYGWWHNVDLLPNRPTSFHNRLSHAALSKVEVLGIWDEGVIWKEWTGVKHLHLDGLLQLSLDISFPHLKSITIWRTHFQTRMNSAFPVHPTIAPNVQTLVSIAVDCVPEDALALIPPTPLSSSAEDSRALIHYAESIRTLDKQFQMSPFNLPYFPNLSTLILSQSDALKYTLTPFTKINFLVLKSITQQSSWARVVLCDQLVSLTDCHLTSFDIKLLTLSCPSLTRLSFTRDHLLEPHFQQIAQIRLLRHLSIKRGHREFRGYDKPFEFDIAPYLHTMTSLVSLELIFHWASFQVVLSDNERILRWSCPNALNREVDLIKVASVYLSVESLSNCSLLTMNQMPVHAWLQTPFL